MTIRRTMTTRRITSSKRFHTVITGALLVGGLSLVALPLGGCATSLQARVPDIFSYEDVPTGEMPSMFDGDVDPTAGLPGGTSELGLDSSGAMEATGPGGVPDPTDVFSGERTSGGALADDGPPQPSQPPTGVTLESLQGGMESRPARDTAAAPRQPRSPQPSSPQTVRSGRVAGGLPPMPAPPAWDPRRDRTVRIGPDGKPLGGRTATGAGAGSTPSSGASAPRGSAGSGAPSATDPGTWLPGSSGARARPELAGPSTSEIGAPPGGALDSPFPMGAAGAPGEPIRPAGETTPSSPTPEPRPTGSPFLSDGPGSSSERAPAREKPRDGSPPEDMLPPTGALPPAIADEGPSLEDVTPADPTPADPTPADPTPADPTPADPTPADPTPADPTPVEPTPTEPSPETPSDPWVPGSGGSAGTKPSEPAPEPAPGGVADDPWATGDTGNTPPAGSGEPAPAGVPSSETPAGETPSAETPAVADDPWSTAPGAGAPTPGGVGAKPSDPIGAADPWESAGNGGLEKPTGTTPGATRAAPGTPAGEYVGKTPEKRALEHTTRLMDQAGSPSVQGYPSAILPSQPAGQALTPGIKPAVVVFYDDTSRISDLQAARILSLLVRYRAEIDFVGVDSGPDAVRTGGGNELAGRFLDQIPTVVVLDSERKTRLYKTGPFSADELERALDLCLTGAPLPGGSESEPKEPAAKDPFALPPADPAANTPEARSGMSFTPPKNYSAKQHVDRLKSAPGDVTVPGYPTELLRSAPAERVLTSGLKPVVILFYDDASKASDLQAAAFLPTLVDRQAEVDLVIIDVSSRARWNDAEKRVVRTYYNFYVPTTVVLAPNLAPVKSWYARTEAEALTRAIDQAKER